MEPISFSALGLTGMSACIWAAKDAFRVVYVETIGRVQAISSISFMEAHTQCLLKMESIEIAMEELAETTLEVLEPFVN